MAALVLVFGLVLVLLVALIPLVMLGLYSGVKIDSRHHRMIKQYISLAIPPHLYIYIYIYIHTFIYIYIYIYMCVCACCVGLMGARPSNISLNLCIDIEGEVFRPC